MTSGIPYRNWHSHSQKLNISHPRCGKHLSLLCMHHWNKTVVSLQLIIAAHNIGVFSHSRLLEIISWFHDLLYPKHPLARWSVSAFSSGNLYCHSDAKFHRVCLNIYMGFLLQLLFLFFPFNLILLDGLWKWVWWTHLLFDRHYELCFTASRSNAAL